VKITVVSISPIIVGKSTCGKWFYYTGRGWSPSPSETAHEARTCAARANRNTFVSVSLKAQNKLLSETKRMRKFFYKKGKKRTHVFSNDLEKAEKLVVAKFASMKLSDFDSQSDLILVDIEYIQPKKRPKPLCY
jgi:hypothetical protein